jgi:hypothetical protein
MTITPVLLNLGYKGNLRLSDRFKIASLPFAKGFDSAEKSDEEEIMARGKRSGWGRGG